LNHVTALICLKNKLAPKMVSHSAVAISSTQVLGLHEQYGTDRKSRALGML